jgi:hypothetical protein
VSLTSRETGRDSNLSGLERREHADHKSTVNLMRVARQLKRNKNPHGFFALAANFASLPNRLKYRTEAGPKATERRIRKS